MKSISTINPAITENTEYLIVTVCATFIDLKVGVLLNHGVSLCCASPPSLRMSWVTFQTKNSVKVSLLALHLP